jgi:hypothetical protein
MTFASHDDNSVDLKREIEEYKQGEEMLLREYYEKRSMLLEGVRKGKREAGLWRAREERDSSRGDSRENTKVIPIFYNRDNAHKQQAVQAQQPPKQKR